MIPLYSQEDFDKAKYKTVFELKCLCCSKTFRRTKKFIFSALCSQQKGRKYAADFCSIACHNNYVRASSRQNVICDQCATSFIKIKSQITKNKHNFCCSSCAATYNNARRIRLKKERIKTPRKMPFSYLIGITKGQLLDKRGVYYKYRSDIQKHARWIYKQNKGDNFCKVCGYSKHIEVAHIKAVSAFQNNTLITDINAFSNLVGLCRNHHWELDHKDKLPNDGL